MGYELINETVFDFADQRKKNNIHCDILITYLHRISFDEYSRAALRCCGDFREPIIPKGSIVVVDLDDKEHIEEKIYCVNIPEGGIDIAAIKRIRIWEKGKGFVLISENYMYPINPIRTGRSCV